MEKETNINIEVKETVETKDTQGLKSKVILYNDEYHTFDDVIIQLIKAIHCTIEKAEALTIEVHTNKKAVVFSGEFEQSLRVSGILREINLKTEVRY
jgi:ATP-dependent Clp protease adaptor protein ClpS